MCEDQQVAASATSVYPGVAMVKAYITKHCLVSGILVVEGEIQREELSVPNGNTLCYYGPKDWYLKWEDALARAEHCRIDRIRSEKRRSNSTVTKLESLTFSKPELM